VPDFRIIPSIDTLRQRPHIAALEQEYGAVATLTALRLATSEQRATIAMADSARDLPADREELIARIEASADRYLTGRFRGSLRPVINATGVIVHTNLGRAPLALPALQRLRQIAEGYSNLEYDLQAGSRGSRTMHAESLLTAVTGAEAALVVNNNAAATLLILTALANGREAIVSRGELVEIGGGFRVPEIMAQSGTVLREVGTTNRTRIADYRAAIGPRTALLMRIHPSNFRIIGFTERPTLAELIETGNEAGIPVVEDLGSGLMLDSIASEPTVQASVAAGAALVCFSGDKLLGAPQSGIIVGRRSLIAQLQQHPLMRAMRVDKLVLAALEGTLIEYLAGRAPSSVPVARMVQMPVEAIEVRATEIAERLLPAGWKVTLVSGSSAIGGGSAPGVELPTVLLAITHATLSASELEQHLRSLEPPVIARLEDGHVVLDLRTVLEYQDETLAEALLAIEA
jgi:L-seryl-tRNA(Ser) seleniumtransferase